MVFPFLLTTSLPVFAQDESAEAPLPIPGAPTTVPPETEEDEEVVEEERRPPPFFLREPLLTDRLLPDATPDLDDVLLFPPNAFTDVRPRERLLQVGRFAISPTIAVAATYDDNVDASHTDRRDDISGNLRAGVEAQSLFERHSLGFAVNASISDPHRNVGEDLSDRVAVRSRADGRLDFTRRSSLSAEASVARGAQNPEAQEAGAQEEPIILTAASAIAYRHQFERVGWQLGGAINRTEADDGDEAAEQDRTSYRIAPGVDYQVSRRLSLFGESAYSINRYDRSGEGGSRDSQIVRADVGANLRLAPTFTAGIGIGYIGVFFDDSERKDQHRPAFAADLDGAIDLDRLTVLRLGLSHSTDLTTADDAALVSRTQLLVAVNRLLTPASAILARVSLSRSDFIGESRTDYDIVPEVAYSHTLIRNVALNVSYRYSQRFSDDNEDEFYRNIVSLGLSASF